MWILLRKILLAKTHFFLIIGLLVLFSFLPAIAPLPLVKATITNGMNATNVLGQYVNGAVSYTQGGINNGWDGKDGFSSPQHITIDTTNHRLFVSDELNNRVLVFNLNTSDALVDYSADFVLGQADFTTFLAINGNLTQSGLNRPRGLVYDSVNNRLFVAEWGNNRVLVFDVAVITNGEAAVNVLGQADFTSNIVATTQSGLKRPVGLFYDSANTRLFVVDSDNNRALVFDVATITNGEAAVNVLGQADFTSNASALTQSGLNDPSALTYDSATTRLFVGDSGNARVMVFNVSTITNGENAVNVLGQTSYVALGPGGPNQTALKRPEGLAYDSAGNRLFVADADSTAGNRVMVFNAATGTLIPDNKDTDGPNAINVLGQANFVTSTAVTTQSGLNGPKGLAYDSVNSRLWAADASNNRVMVFDVAAITNGEDAVNVSGQSNSGVVTYTEKGAQNSSNSIGLYDPYYTAIDTVNHRLFVSDGSNHRVLGWNLNSSDALVDYTADFVLGKADFTTNNYATTQSGLNRPVGLAYDNTNNRLFVAGSDARVLVYDTATITNGEDAVYVLGQTNFTSSTAATTQSGLGSYAGGLAYDSVNNRLFVADDGNNRVMVFDVTTITNGEDAINVLGQANFTSNASALTQSGLGSANGLNATSGLVYDSANNRLFVGDSGNSRVMVFDVTTITNGEDAINVLGQANFTSNTVAVTQSGLNSPMGLAYDSVSSRLFAADSSASGNVGNRVMVFDVAVITNGENAINVLGQANFTSNTLATTQSGLRGPHGLTYSATTGDLYVTDLSNNRVMIFALNTVPTATAPGSISQATDGTGYVTFQTTISDADSNNTKIKVEFSDDSGSTWYDADLVSATPSSGTVDLDDAQNYQIGSVNPIDTSTGDITLTIVWNSKGVNGKDVSAINSSTMQIRVTPNDSIQEGVAVAGATFAVNNAPAPTGGSSIAINPPPGPVTNTSPTATSSSVILTWNNPGDNDLAGIEIWRNNCAGGGVDQLLATLGARIITYTDNNIQPNTTCLYLLISKDTNNSRTPSQEVSVAIPATTPPPPFIVCGNSLCEDGETPSSCAADCVAAKPNLVLTLTAQIKSSAPITAATPVSSVALALSTTVFLFGIFLIHIHTGAENGPARFFAIFPLLFTSSRNSYMYLKKCGPDKCQGSHFVKHKALKYFTRISLIATVGAGIVKLVLMIAIISFLPGSQGLQAETLNVRAGDTITSILTVQNIGAVSANNVIVKVPTPNGAAISNLLVNGLVSAAELNTGLVVTTIASNEIIVISADYAVLSSALNFGVISFKGQATAEETSSKVFESEAVTLAVTAQLPVSSIAPPIVPVIPAPPILPEPPLIPPVQESSEPAIETSTRASAEPELIIPVPVVESVPGSSIETAVVAPPRRGSSLQAITSADINQLTANFENKLAKELQNAAQQGIATGSIKADFNIAELLAEVSPDSLVQRGFVPVLLRVQVIVPDNASIIKVMVESDPQIFTFMPNNPIEEYIIPVSLAVGPHQVTVQAIDRVGESITLDTAAFQVSLPACFDGLDNDSDGFMDEQDPGCASRDDNDEFQVPAQIIMFIAPEAVVKVAEKATTAVLQTKTYRILDKQVLNNPVVESATIKVAAPVIVATAAANVGTAVNFASLLAYLQGFLTQPLLLFTKRKRKQWGVVYSSLTKLPVDLALVRLFSAETGKLIQTRVTDKYGRYLFLANPGSYIMKVQKPGFIFPSELLKAKTSDFDFVEIYHGETISVQAQSTTLTPVIPIDPIEKSEAPEDVLKHKRKRSIQKGVAWTGPMFALVSVAIHPTLATTALLALQFGLLGLFKRLAQGKAPKSWSSVVDQQTGKPIAFAVARIFDAQFNKLLETQITDKNGRYAFLVGKGKFYITVQKLGYVQYKSALIDLTKLGVGDIVKQDIKLKKENGKGDPAE